MNRMLLFQQHKWLLGVLYLLGIVLAVGRFRYSFESAISLDPAIILTEMESIANGYIPYKTMHLNYPPLYFYILVGLKHLFGIPYGCYNFYLAVNLVFLAGSAICLDVIAREMTKNALLSDFCAWLFILTMAKLQAWPVMFAVPSMFFGLFSCVLCFLFRDKHPALFLLVGMVAACSFLVKQFGAGYFALVLYLIICFSEKSKWQRGVFFSLGYCVPIIFVLFIFGWEFVESTLLNGYGTINNALKGENVSIGHKMSMIFENGILSIWQTFMVVASALCLLPLAIIQGKWKELVFCFCGFAGFCFQYYFCSSGDIHYRQYMAPFAMLMIPILLSLDYKGHFVAYLICMTGICLTLFKPMKNALNHCVKRPLQNYCETGRKDQQLQAEELLGHIRSGSTIWIGNTALQHLYYFTNLPTPNMKEVGYSAGPWEITMEAATMQVKSSDYVLCCPYNNGNDEFDYYMKPLLHYLESFHCDTITEYMLLYDMRDSIATDEKKGES